MNIIERAMAFALKAHEGQTRKFSTIPYILHPAEVSTIAAALTDKPEVIAAALLHDTIEDTDTTKEEILEQFGPYVCELVLSETEDKMPDLPETETWLTRKAQTLLVLKETKNIDVKILWLSDKLANLRSIYRDYAYCGDEVWNKFHQKDKKMQEWYYRTVASYVAELHETPAYEAYDVLVEALFGENTDTNETH